MDVGKGEKKKDVVIKAFNNQSRALATDTCVQFGTGRPNEDQWQVVAIVITATPSRWHGGCWRIRQKGGERRWKKKRRRRRKKEAAGELLVIRAPIAPRIAERTKKKRRGERERERREIGRLKKGRERKCLDVVCIYPTVQQNSHQKIFKLSRTGAHTFWKGVYNSNGLADALFCSSSSYLVLLPPTLLSSAGPKKGGQLNYSSARPAELTRRGG